MTSNGTCPTLRPSTRICTGQGTPATSPVQFDAPVKVSLTSPVSGISNVVPEVGMSTGVVEPAGPKTALLTEAAATGTAPRGA